MTMTFCIFAPYTYEGDTCGMVRIDIENCSYKCTCFVCLTDYINNEMKGVKTPT